MEKKCREMCATYGSECGSLYNFISEIHSIRSTVMAEYAGLRRSCGTDNLPTAEEQLENVKYGEKWYSMNRHVDKMLFKSNLFCKPCTCDCDMKSR